MTPGSKLYQIEYIEDVVKNDMPSLSTSAKKLIKKAIEERLMADPIGFGSHCDIALKDIDVCELVIIGLFTASKQKQIPSLLLQ